jgi:hypothetical protein
MNIKIGLVAIAVITSFNLQAQAVTTTAETKTTVGLSDVDVEKARKMTQERSDIRNRDDVLGLHSTKLTKEIKFEELKTDLAKQKFISSNVPIEVQIQGDAAIAAFLETKFNQPNSVKSYEMKTVWQSSDSVMYIPQVQQSEPVVDFTVETKRVEPEPERTTLNVDEEQALAALGISSDDLNNLTKSKIKDTTPETHTKEVILSEFKSTGHIVSGDYRRADIKLTFTIKEGGRLKYVDKKINNIQPGDSFSIESNGYIVVDVNSYGVIVREKTTGHTYNSAG